MAMDLKKRFSKTHELLTAHEDQKKEKAGDLIPRDRPRFWWFTLLILGMVMMAVGLITCVDVGMGRPQPQGTVVTFGALAALVGLTCISMYFHKWGKL